MSEQKLHAVLESVLFLLGLMGIGTDIDGRTSGSTVVSPLAQWVSAVDNRTMRSAEQVRQYNI